MSSFNYFRDADVYRVTGKVVSSKFDIDADVIEFSVNDPPKTKSLLVATSEKYHNYTMRSVINITTVDTTITNGQ